MSGFERADALAKVDAWPRSYGTSLADGLTPTGLETVRGLARDTVAARPDPIAEYWVSNTIEALASLVLSVEDAHERLTPQNLFGARTVARCLHRYRADIGPARRMELRYRLVESALAHGLVLPPDPEMTDRTPEDAGTALTRQEEAHLLAWVAALPAGVPRRRFLALLGLSLGCGARALDTLTVHAADVEAGPAVVRVMFRPADGRDRTVVCRAPYEAMLAEAAADGPPDRLLVTRGKRGPAADPKVIQRRSIRVWVARYEPPVAVTVTRLRLTWLVRHLEAGTPLAVLLPAASISADRLGELVPDVPVAPDADHRLRDAL